MATRNFAYDHPAYLVPVQFSGQIAAGAATVMRFLAHADLLAKKARAKSVVAGTSANETVILYKVSGTATTALGTMTLGSSASVNYSASVDLADAAITAGDEIRFLSGTDATHVVAVSLEAVVTPGASFQE
jgi:hypothetical protein